MVDWVWTVKSQWIPVVCGTSDDPLLEFRLLHVFCCGQSFQTKTFSCLIWDHTELPYLGPYWVALFWITPSCLIWDHIELPYLGQHWVALFGITLSCLIWDSSGKKMAPTVWNILMGKRLGNISLRVQWVLFWEALWLKWTMERSFTGWNKETKSCCVQLYKLDCLKTPAVFCGADFFPPKLWSGLCEKKTTTFFRRTFSFNHY